MTGIVKKNTLLLSFPDKSNPHLHIILLNPIGTNPSKTVIVNISTFRSHVLAQDTTVILQKGDHPFINHTSYVDYNYAKKVNVNVILDLVNKNYAKFYDDVDDDVFGRILNGLFTSTRTPRDIKSYCRKNK